MASILEMDSPGNIQINNIKKNSTESFSEREKICGFATKNAF